MACTSIKIILLLKSVISMLLKTPNATAKYGYGKKTIIFKNLRGKEIKENVNVTWMSKVEER